MSQRDTRRSEELAVQINNKLVEKLATSDQRFRQLVEGQPDVVFSCSPTGLIDYLSPVAERVFGRKPEDCIGGNLSDLLHKDSPLGAKDILSALEKGSSAADLRFLLTARDGSPVWMKLQVAPSKSDSRIGSWHNVSDAVRGEKEMDALHNQLTASNNQLQVQSMGLAQRNELQALLVDISQNFVQHSSSDADTLIEDALARIGHYMGVDRGYVMILNHEDHSMSNTHEWCAEGTESHHGKFLSDSYDRFPWQMACLRSGSAIHIPRVEDLPREASAEKQALQRSGVQSLIALPMLTQDKLQGYVAFESIRKECSWDVDIVDVLQLIGNMFHGARDRERVERLKSEFIASVSHELRTPLTSILGFSRTLSSKTDIKEDTRQEFMEIIHSQSVRLQALIESLLEISRIESGIHELQLGDLDLEELVTATCAQLAEKATAGNVTLTVHIEPDIAYATQLDAGRMRSVIENLAGNAIKFTPKNGEVKIGLSVQGSNYELTISDTGFGIPANELDRIFERFYRIQHPGREIQGTGLGLAITREIVSLHGGSIQVESTVGKGSKFTVTLPRKR